ncbi:SLATT domain-containing protein [Nocardia sp. CDC153]|uniref:SLATT domain-containing protein n=1 Tax=Nocardia sp. CDC153 TaxID=3112167 RepID=UPI003FA3A014
MDALGDSSQYSAINQLNRLRLRSHRAARAQYLSAHYMSVMHFRLGVPAVVLSSAVGTTVFGTLVSSPNSVIIIGTGILSVTSAVLAALQTFFGLSERSENHRASGAKYASLKRQLDIASLRWMSEQVSIVAQVEELTCFVTEFNELDAQSPRVRDRFYDQARREQELDAEGV